MALRFYKKNQKDKLASDIKNIFGFKPENISLYKLAFMHKSAHIKLNQHEISNERLEFLGDAVIGLIVADFLFKKFPFANEGELTEMRSRIVSRNSLNKIADNLNIEHFITKGNHHVCNSLTGNAFEAFFGAVYLDKGYRFAKNLLINFIFNRIADIESLIYTDKNFKNKLLQYCQREKKELEFVIVDTAIEKHKKIYFCEVKVDGETIGEGNDYNIKSAEQNASEKALDYLKNKGIEFRIDIQ